MQCRICDHPLDKFMSFGKMPIANGFLEKKDFEHEYFFELAPAICSKCNMFQLITQPNPNIMFHENYAFLSQTSKGMIAHFKQMFQDIKKYIQHSPATHHPFIIEIGSNDGILLQHAAAENISHLGIEPSRNVANIAQKNGINTLNAFFNEETAQNIYQQYGMADAIVAANVMCHIADFRSVIHGIHRLLKPNGILIFEDPYLADVIQKTSYDQIYDEHVFLFCVNSIQNAFKHVDMEVIDAIWQPTHGGSMRYILAKKNQYPISNNVLNQLRIEKELRLCELDTYYKFKQKCETSKKLLYNLLEEIAAKKEQVVGYAATSKSTTVINYCNLTPKHINFISDTTPIKQGKYSPGAHIPIKSYSEFQNNYPDYALLFAWNHSAEILQKEQTFTKSGGKWILFVPEVKIAESISYA